MDQSTFDGLILARHGVVEVRASESAPFPALSFTADGHRYLLELDGEMSTLHHGGGVILVVRYRSSLDDGRVTLEGWEHAPGHLGPLRWPLAYLIAIQRHARNSGAADRETG